MAQREYKENESAFEQEFKNVDNDHHLILFNDNVHSFEYVIDALVEVCNHSNTQAMQCTVLTHYKGKCDVKRGSYDHLKKIKQEMNNRNLIVTIN